MTQFRHKRNSHAAHIRCQNRRRAHALPLSRAPAARRRRAPPRARAPSLRAASHARGHAHANPVPRRGVPDSRGGRAGARRPRGRGRAPSRSLPPPAALPRRRRGRARRRLHAKGRSLARQPRRAARGRDSSRGSRQGFCVGAGRRPNGCRWVRPRRARASEQRDPGAARLAARRRARHRAEDPRLPPAARSLQLDRRPGRDSGHRPGAARTASGRRRAVSGLLRARPHALAAALCLGLALANVLREPSRALSLVAVALALGAAVAPERRVPLLALALLLAGWWWGSARLEALDRSPLLPHVGSAGWARVVVTGPARRSRYELRVPGQMRRFRDDVIREPVLLRLPPGRSPPQGAVLALVGELRLPRGPEDGFDERTWLRRHGVHVVVRASRWRVVGHRGGLGGLADGLRARLARSMAPGLHGERRAVLAGIVLGEDEGLSDELRTRFRASGLYHLLAVSGQNVALIAGGTLFLCWLVGLSRLFGQLAALGAIGGYVLAVGWQPSVVRAGIAGALASLAWLASRPQDRWYFLLLGAAILLAWNPYSLLDAGFQLSFAAVAAIFVAVPRLERSLEGYPLPHSLAEVVAVSAACGLATAPILLAQLGSVPLYSIPAN